MAAVLNNAYADEIDELVVIDCRYPYEYDGGHIAVGDLISLSFFVCQQLFKTKFHYAILVADRFEAGRRPAASWNFACHLAR